MDVNIVISYIRDHSYSDWQLRMLLRSIEKHFTAPKITILGDNPFHFLSSDNLTFKPVPMNKDGKIINHAKAILYSIYNIHKGYFVFNGTIFVKDMKKSEDFLLPVVDKATTPSYIRKPIEEMVSFTIKQLQTIKRYRYVTYPFVPFMFDEDRIREIAKKFPEILTENHYIQTILANFLPNKKLRIYKTHRLNCVSLNSFTDFSKPDFKYRKCIYIDKEQANDFVVRYKVEGQFEKKSRWEL